MNVTPDTAVDLTLDGLFYTIHVQSSHLRYLCVAPSVVDQFTSSLNYVVNELATSGLVDSRDPHIEIRTDHSLGANPDFAYTNPYSDDGRAIQELERLVKKQSDEADLMAAYLLKLHERNERLQTELALMNTQLEGKGTN